MTNTDIQPDATLESMMDGPTEDVSTNEAPVDAAPEQTPLEVVPEPNQDSVGTVAAQDDDAETPVDETPEPEQMFTQAQLNEIVAQRADRAKRSAARKYEGQLQELRSQLPQDAKPVIPELPDPYEVSEAEYKQAIADRDQAIMNVAAYDATQKAEKDRQAQAENARQQEAQQKFVDSVNSYEEKAKGLGVDPTQSVNAINQNFDNNVAVGLVNLTSQMDDGPLVLDYLARNQGELVNLVGKPMETVALHLATKVSPKVNATRQVTKAPQPASSVSGGGVNPMKAGPLSSEGSFD